MGTWLDAIWIVFACICSASFFSSSDGTVLKFQCALYRRYTVSKRSEGEMYGRDMETLLPAPAKLAGLTNCEAEEVKEAIGAFDLAEHIANV